MSLATQNNNNFFNRMYNTFRPFKNLVVSTGIGYVSYQIAYKLLENVPQEKKNFITHLACLSYAGLGLVSANKFSGYPEYKMAMNIMGGMIFGVYMPPALNYIIPIRLQLNLTYINSILFGIMSAGCYVIGCNWYYEMEKKPVCRITPCEDCGNYNCRANYFN